MFGTNQSLTPHEFDNEPKDTLKVTALWATIQGEGPFAGHPAVFLRLAHCNLQCSFCDTWFDSGDRMKFEDINASIEAACAPYPLWQRYKPMLVITGGEPLMQNNLPEFIMARAMQEEVQIETNGNFDSPLPWWVSVVISPKVNEKTHKHVKVSPAMLDRAEALKFLISDSMEGYRDVPDWALRWRDEVPTARHIYLSPMNCYAKQPAIPTAEDSAAVRAERERISFWTPGLLDAEKNRRNHEYAAALAMQLGCYLSLQQHLYASLP
jgi:7-carboxy-7-deazaguanine synthase